MPTTQSPAQRRIYRIADLELSPELRSLRRGALAIAVEPRVLDLILLLVRERERIVTKQELFDEVWSDVVVAPGALDRAVYEARRVLGDRGDRQEMIRTIRGRGYRFVAPVEESIVASDAGRPPLFGRDDVLAELSAVVERHRHALRLVAIEGEAGIGKTSVAERAADMAIRRGFALRTGRCTATFGSPPFWPWIQLLGHDGEGRADPRVGLPAELAAALDGSAEGRFGDGSEQARFRLFDAFVRHFQRTMVSSEVWLLDDLQWADDASLRLLAHLAGASFADPLLIVATFRNEGVDATHPIRRMLERCANRAPVDRLSLRGLDASALRALGSHLVGEAPTPEAIEMLRRRTGGNPFLASELLLKLGRTPNDAAARSPSSSSSSDLASLLRSRLELVDDGIRELLAIAAVIGREFDAARVAAVSRRDVELVRRGLEDAMTAGIVIGDGRESGRYAFRHDLLRESLYASLSAEMRATLHRRVGEALETLYGPHADGRIDELALHFHEAADQAVDGKAFDYAIRAGRSALAQFGFEQASHHFENALSSLDRERTRSLRRQAQVLLALADAAKRSGDKLRSQDALHRAADLARQLDDANVLIQAAFVMQRAHSPIEVSTAEVRDVELLREALDRVPVESRAVRARLLARLATALYWRPIHVRPKRRDVDQPTLEPHELEAFGWSAEVSSALADEAIRTARDADDPLALAHALGAKYIASTRTARNDERRDLAAEIVRLAKSSDDWELRLVSQGLLLTELVQRGDGRGAAACVEALRDISERLRHPLSRWHAALGQVLESIVRGRFEEAKVVATDAYRRTLGEVNLAVEDCFIQQRFSIDRMTGRMAELESALREAASRYGRMSNFVMMLALIALERGDAEAARRELDWVCANDFAEIGENMLSLYTTTLAAEVCAAVGSREQSHSLYERLLPHRGRCATINFVCFEGPVDRALGLLAERMGDEATASTHLGQAIDQMRSMESVAWLAQCLFEAGEIGSRDPACRSNARRQVREAEDLAKRHGFVLLRADR